MNIKELIRTIPDYPKKGIMFRDVTTLLSDAKGFGAMIDQFKTRYQNQKIDLIAGIEARGFIVGSALAYALNIGFIPIRKKGKLPGKTISESYQLEYGTDTIEVHEGSIAKGQQVLLMDDLIATGGTALAAASLINKLGGDLVEAAFIVDLPDLGGHKKLIQKDIKVFTLCEFEGD